MYKFLAFVTQGFRIASSYKINFVNRYLSVVFMLLLYYFMDRLVAQNGVSQVGGGSYFTFLLVGGIFAQFLNLTVRAFSVNIREELLAGTIEPLLVTATPTVWALLGPASWGLLEGLVMIGVQLGLGAWAGADFSRANWAGAALVMLFSLSSLLSYGLFSAGFIIVYKRSDPINQLVQAAVHVFSGVFFPVATLPPWLRTVSYALPFTYSIEGLRGALIRGEGLAALLPQIGALALFTVLLVPLGLGTLAYAIRHMKRTGSLSHY
ncbi:MAG: ABC transporter permease [Anaerolineales bacterium]|nr:ABC transporter permease [Anaerolineales bacterium]